jgi:hypothetical protein
MKGLRLILLLIFFSQAVSAGCLDFLSRFFNAKTFHFKFSESALEQIDINENILFGYEKLSNSPPEFFFYILSQYPKEFIEALKNSPRSQSERLEFKEQFLKALGFTHYQHNSMSRVIVEYVLRYDDRFIEPKEIEQGLSRLVKMSPVEFSKLRAQVAKDMQEAKAAHYYRSSFYKKLTLLKKENAMEIVVKNSTYKVLEFDGKSVSFLVPKNKVRHPVWNPLEKPKLNSIIQNPSANPVPKAYRVAVGLDGFFYLEDGNHRFHLLENRDEIQVVIAWPARTLGISTYLDYIAVPV